MSTEKDREAADVWRERFDKIRSIVSRGDERVDLTITEVINEVEKLKHARQGERGRLIKFITWVRNHYAVNALIDNKGMVDFYLGQEKSK